MDIDRVKRYCERMIQQEKAKPTPSADKISSFEQMLFFMNNADTPDKDELIKVEEIFCSYHLKHKHTKYPVVKSDRLEFSQMIMQIKLEMETNPDKYVNFTAVQFFEMFMANMDDWHIKNWLTPYTLNKKFREILGAVKTKAIGGKQGGAYKKLTYQSVMTDK